MKLQEIKNNNLKTNQIQMFSLENKNTISGPVVIGGVGGSGTRVVAEILRELNYYIGNDLNGPLDNLTYTLLFKRRKWFYSQHSQNKNIFKGLSILEKKMLRLGSLSFSEYFFLVNAVISMSIHGHNKEKDGSGKWPLERLKKMFEPLAVDLHCFTGWGWKEPNSHLLIESMNNYFPNFKYIHTIRHGLDMAFSTNQQQLFNWAPFFGVDLPNTKEGVPGASFRYWVEANQSALEKGSKLGSASFFYLNYDQLCKDPEPELQKLLIFLNIKVNDSIFKKCAALPKISTSTGRYHNFNLNSFKENDLQFLQSIGFII